jgi:hypothetical protein
MAQTIATTHTRREPGLLYYVKKGDIWASPMKKPGGASAKGKARKIVPTGVELDYSRYLYFVGTSKSGFLTVDRAARAR